LEVPAGGGADQLAPLVEFSIGFIRIVSRVALGICVCDGAAIFDEGQDAETGFPRGLADGAKLSSEIVNLAAAAKNCREFRERQRRARIDAWPRLACAKGPLFERIECGQWHGAGAPIFGGDWARLSALVVERSRRAQKPHGVGGTGCIDLEALTH
jgi:hypothetical protein